LPGCFKFQPSQFMIPITSLFLLTHINLQTKYTKLKEVWPLLGLWLLPAVLIGLEPDFGSMIVYLGGTGVVLAFYSIPPKWWLGFFGVGLLGLVLAWFLVFKPYQRDRIIGFLNPSFTDSVSQTETSAQYNARQAMIAVGSGTLVGRGLGYGVQSHLRFLPERQTDFMFASLSEELGFMGSILVVGSYAALIGFVVWLAVAQEKPQKTAYLMSFAVWIFVQASINLGMNVGLLPITGITLPFLSYGGSSILGLSLGLGIVQIVNAETQKKLVLHIR
jgi:rod shape determining protein RodA